MFKSGGRVVKNVTGYDLCKLLAGSWGTLAAMTDITVKTLPRAETEATLLVAGPDDAQGRRGHGDGVAVVCDVSGAAHFRARWQRGCPAISASAKRRPRCGSKASERFGHASHGVATNSDAVPGGPLLVLDVRSLAPLWHGDLRRRRFAAERAGWRTRIVWRISTAPAQGAKLGRSSPPRPMSSSLMTGLAASSGRRSRPPMTVARRSCAPPSPLAAAMPRWCARPPRCAPRCRYSSRRPGPLGRVDGAGEGEL